MSCTAFAGTRCIASGDVAAVALKTKQAIDSGDIDSVLIFDDASSELIELDFRGTPTQVLKRLQTPQPASGPDSARGPGRPKLGVVGREVTLLPRHWDWLNAQPGGASVALRKLVEHARRANEGRDRVRAARDAAYRFMSAMAGNEPGFEEASRALFAGNQTAFDDHIRSWPADVRTHARKLAAAAIL